MVSSSSLSCRTSPSAASATCPRERKSSSSREIGAELVAIANQLLALLPTLTGLPDTLASALGVFATAVSNIGIALQTSPCRHVPQAVFCLLNCLLITTVTLIVSAGSSAAPGVSFASVLSLLARIQCVIAPLSVSRHASLASSASPEVTCALFCQAVFQLLAATLALLSAFLSVAGEAGGTAPFVAVSASAAALNDLAYAIIRPDTSILGCGPIETTPCVLPCALNGALTAAIPVYALAAGSLSLSSPPTVPPIVHAVQDALATLTGTGCLPGVLSPCAPVPLALQSALVPFLASLTALNFV